MKIINKFPGIFLILIIILSFGCRQWFKEYFGIINYVDRTHFTFIGCAMGCYTKATGKMPSNILDKEGKPLLSWRVAVLKSDLPELYEQFNLDEPWNSPHNMKVALTVPFYYIDPKGPKCTPISKEPISTLWIMDPKALNYTPYLGVTGSTAAFRTGSPRDAEPKNSFGHAAIVVVDKSDVFWSEPRDISLEEAKKGDTLRWYKNRTMYLTTQGVSMEWEKDGDRKANGEMNHPPNYEFESDE